MSAERILKAARDAGVRVYLSNGCACYDARAATAPFGPVVRLLRAHKHEVLDYLRSNSHAGMAQGAVAVLGALRPPPAEGQADGASRTAPGSRGTDEGARVLDRYRELIRLAESGQLPTYGQYTLITPVLAHMDVTSWVLRICKRLRAGDVAQDDIDDLETMDQWLTRGRKP